VHRDLAIVIREDLAYPANSFSPAGEWGRADTDRRHQFNLLGTASLHRWTNFGLSAA
jgi:hypothetical protein